MGVQKDIVIITCWLGDNGRVIHFVADCSDGYGKTRCHFLGCCEGSGSGGGGHPLEFTHAGPVCRTVAVLYACTRPAA